MILYILSIIVFIAIASLIGFFLGRASVGKRLKRMEKDMDSLQFRDEEMDRNYSELLDQLKIQGHELERSKIREQKLDEILQKLAQEKKLLAAESNETKDDIKHLRKRQDDLGDKLAVTETREREALRWRNEYVRLNYTLEDKLRRLELQLEKMKEISTVSEPAALSIGQHHDNLPHQQVVEREEKESKPKQDELESLKNEMTELQIKTKRQEHIIRALRMQLKNLNIEKIRQTNTEDLEQQVEKEFDESEGVDITDYHEDVVLENDFSEAIDEIVGQPDELFPESLSFKEQKLRKTGNEVLDFTKVHRRVNQMQSKTEDSGDGVEEGESFSSDVNWKKLLGGPSQNASNLSLIFNMNSRTAKSLQALGINSFEQLSRLDTQHHASLETALKLPPGTIANEKWVKQAGNLCSEENINSIFLRTRSNPVQEGPVEEKIDLTRIRGIGRTYKKRLEGAGITSIQNLADWEDGNLEELAVLISVPAEKIRRERWLHQARQLSSMETQSEE